MVLGADSKLVSKEEAAREVKTVKANLDAVFATMRQMNERRLAGLDLLEPTVTRTCQTSEPDWRSARARETSGLGAPV